MMDKNGITQLWTVKCWWPAAGLLHNPKELFSAAMCEIQKLCIGGVHSARLKRTGGKPGGGIADIKKTQEIYIKCYSLV
jgi:hypothetical protein